MSSSSKPKTIPLLGELESAVNGGFVTDINQVRGGSSTINGVTLSSDRQYILFNHGYNEICRIEANKLLATGLLSGVELKENLLEMKFNLNGSEQIVSVPLSQIFSPGDYYTKTEVDQLIDSKQMSFVLFDKYIDSDDIPDESIITDQSAPTSEEIKDRGFETAVVYLGKISQFALEINNSGLFNYYLTWEDCNLYNTGSTIHGGRFFVCNGCFYFKDSDKLQKLSVSDIKAAISSLIPVELKDFKEENITPMTDRLATLEDKVFPITMTYSAAPSYSSYDGNAKSANFTLKFTKNDTSFTPDSITVTKTSGGSVKTVYSNENPESHSVSFTDSNINATITTYKITITKDGTTKTFSKEYNLYPPLFVGCANLDETFDILVLNLSKTYANGFSGIKEFTNNVDNANIFVMIPSNRTLTKFTYSDLNVPVSFTLMPQNETLNGIAYKIYRSDTGNITKGVRINNLSITLQ